MGVIFYQEQGSTKRGERSGLAGFTLVEMLVVTTIGAVLVALAAPGFVDMLDKRRIEGPAEALLSDMQFAKSEALKRGREVRIVFTRTSAASWCYGLTHANTCDCTITDTTNAAFCYLDINQNGASDIGTSTSDPVRVLKSDEWPRVEMSALNYAPAVPSGPPTVTFGPPYGVAPDGSIDFSSDRNNFTMRVMTGEGDSAITTGLGRVRICSPTDTGTAQITGYAKCPPPPP